MVTAEQIREWTNGQLWDYAVGALAFDFKRIGTGIEMMYPYMPSKETLPLIRMVDREMVRRGAEFRGYIELQLIADDNPLAEFSDTAF